MKYLSLLVLMLICSCSAGSSKRKLKTVDYVEVNKYLGKWYEISKLPNRFQKKCQASQANYSLNNDGSIKVVNKCITDNGEIKKAKGKATIANTNTNAVLKVSFFFLQRWFSGVNYYILDLADDYSYVLVGSPNRDYLWILSRTKTLDNKIVKILKVKAKQLGFDTSKMKSTPSWPQE